MKHKKTPTSETLMITPVMAAKWLEGNTHNRPIRDSRVHQYANDMKEDRWRLTHQGIAFDSNDKLIDGQHRLWAIVEANVSVEMMVAYGFDPDTQQFIDEGMPRSVADVLRLANPDSKVTTYKVAVARRMLVGTRTQVILSRHELIEFMDKHEKAIEFAIDDVFRSKRVMRANPAPVSAAIARASYFEDKNRLREFGAILLGDLPKDTGDTGAHLLRGWLMTGAHEYGQRISRDLLIYMKSQRAIMACIRNEHMRSLYVMKDEAWPLPDEHRRGGSGVKKKEKKPKNS